MIGWKMRRKLSKLMLSVSMMVILTFITACSESVSGCCEYSNPYNLEIVYCIDTYNKQVATNPDLALVDLEKLIPGIGMDIRYATANNFTGTVIYTAPKAFVRKPLAVALIKVQDSLSRLGLGLKIYDAYRPYSATVKFFEVYPDTNFVANPRYGSRHNRGGAVDLSLISLSTGKEVQMPTEYDDFTEKAHPDYMDLPAGAIANRELLFGVMQHFGFAHFPTEWWHFDFEGWNKFPLMDLKFEELGK